MYITFDLCKTKEANCGQQTCLGYIWPKKEIESDEYVI